MQEQLVIIEIILHEWRIGGSANRVIDAASVFGDALSQIAMPEYRRLSVRSQSNGTGQSPLS